MRRLLLDEMLGQAVARGVRAEGLDVVAVVERADLVSASDDDVLAVATAEDRLVVTRNVPDFVALHARRLAEGRVHAGVVCVASRSFPEDSRQVGRLVRALVRTAADGHLAQPGELTFLQASSE